jgi:hypothetical protein
MTRLHLLLVLACATGAAAASAAIPHGSSSSHLLAAGVAPEAAHVLGLSHRPLERPEKLLRGDSRYLRQSPANAGKQANGLPDPHTWLAKYGYYDAQHGYWNFIPNADGC